MPFSDRTFFLNRPGIKSYWFLIRQHSHYLNIVQRPFWIRKHISKGKGKVGCQNPMQPCQRYVQHNMKQDKLDEGKADTMVLPYISCRYPVDRHSKDDDQSSFTYTGVSISRSELSSHSVQLIDGSSIIYTDVLKSETSDHLRISEIRFTGQQPQGISARKSKTEIFQSREECVEKAVPKMVRNTNSSTIKKNTSSFGGSVDKSVNSIYRSKVSCTTDTSVDFQSTVTERTSIKNGTGYDIPERSIVIRHKRCVYDSASLSMKTAKESYSNVSTLTVYPFIERKHKRRFLRGDVVFHDNEMLGRTKKRTSGHSMPDNIPNIQNEAFGKLCHVMAFKESKNLKFSQLHQLAVVDEYLLEICEEFLSHVRSEEEQENSAEVNDDNDEVFLEETDLTAKLTIDIIPSNDNCLSSKQVNHSLHPGTLSKSMKATLSSGSNPVDDTNYADTTKNWNSKNANTDKNTDHLIPAFNTLDTFTLDTSGPLGKMKQTLVEIVRKCLQKKTLSSKVNKTELYNTITELKLLFGAPNFHSILLNSGVKKEEGVKIWKIVKNLLNDSSEDDFNVLDGDEIRSYGRERFESTTSMAWSVRSKDSSKQMNKGKHKKSARQDSPSKSGLDTVAKIRERGFMVEDEATRELRRSLLRQLDPNKTIHVQEKKDNDVATVKEKTPEEKAAEMHESEAEDLRASRQSKRGRRVYGFQALAAEYEKKEYLKRRVEKILEKFNEDTDGRIEAAEARARKDTGLDFAVHAELISKNKLEQYAKLFALEDDSGSGIIQIKDLDNLIERLAAFFGLSKKYSLFIIEAFGLRNINCLTIKMFCVIAAVLENLQRAGNYVRKALDKLTLADIQKNIYLYREMYSSNCDMTGNFISTDDVKLEMTAGGLTEDAQNTILKKLEEESKISFLEYTTYIPLFLTFHSKIVANIFEDKL